MPSGNGKLIKKAPTPFWISNILEIIELYLKRANDIRLITTPVTAIVFLCFP